MSDAKNDSRASIIRAVKTPLGFMTLGLLLIDGTLAGLAFALQDQTLQRVLVWAVVISLPVFIGIVVLVAVFRPEALQGARPWQQTFAGHFADDLFLALDGAISNLQPLERAEAWATLADVITSDNGTDVEYRAFCVGVANRLRQRADLVHRKIATRGTIGK